jgi:hypothetical protein
MSSCCHGPALTRGGLALESCFLFFRKEGFDSDDEETRAFP